MGHKSSDKCPYKRHLEDRQRRGRQYDTGGRGWSDVTASQGMLGAARGWKREGMDSPLDALEGACPYRYVDFRLLTLRNVRE